MSKSNDGIYVIAGALIGAGLYKIFWDVYGKKKAEQAAAKALNEEISREYEAKFRKQAEQFLKKFYELEEQINKLRQERDNARTFSRRLLTFLHKNKKFANKQESEEHELNTILAKFVEDGLNLQKEFELHIDSANEHGFDIDDEAMDYYEQLTNFTNDIKNAVEEKM